MEIIEKGIQEDDRAEFAIDLLERDFRGGYLLNEHRFVLVK